MSLFSPLALLRVKSTSCSLACLEKFDDIYDSLGRANQKTVPACIRLSWIPANPQTALDSPILDDIYERRKKAGMHWVTLIYLYKQELLKRNRTLFSSSDKCLGSLSVAMGFVRVGFWNSFCRGLFFQWERHSANVVCRVFVGEIDRVRSYSLSISNHGLNGTLNERWALSVSQIAAYWTNQRLVQGIISGERSFLLKLRVRLGSGIRRITLQMRKKWAQPCPFNISEILQKQMKPDWCWCWLLLRVRYLEWENMFSIPHLTEFLITEQGARRWGGRRRLNEKRLWTTSQHRKSEHSSLL